MNFWLRFRPETTVYNTSLRVLYPYMQQTFFQFKLILPCRQGSRGHSSKLREISFTRLTIEKKYFFNKINLYVLEQCAFMAIISFYSLKIIFGHFTRCNWTCLLSMVFVFFFGGIWYKNGLFGATTHKYIDFTALNAGIR